LVMESVWMMASSISTLIKPMVRIQYTASGISHGMGNARFKIENIPCLNH
jgi:hypothetical protein